MLPGEYPRASAEVWGLEEIDSLRALNLSSLSSWVQFNENVFTRNAIMIVLRNLYLIDLINMSNTHH